MSFASSMEAKEFLVSRIVEEASRQHVRLSELERKMLYFSERYPTLPDIMEVNEKFEAEYDSEEYEGKIKGLARKALRHDQKESPENVPLWREAIQMLNKEDHYILVMLDVPLSGSYFLRRPPADFAKLAVTGLAVVGLSVAAVAAIHWVNQNVHSQIPDNIKLLSFIVVFVLAYYLVYSKKWEVVGAYVSKLLERVARWF
jgi:hypothetical protein